MLSVTVFHFQEYGCRKYMWLRFAWVLCIQFCRTSRTMDMPGLVWVWVSVNEANLYIGVCNSALGSVKLSQSNRVDSGSFDSYVLVCQPLLLMDVLYLKRKAKERRRWYYWKIIMQRLHHSPGVDWMSWHEFLKFLNFKQSWIYLNYFVFGFCKSMNSWIYKKCTVQMRLNCNQ